MPGEALTGGRVIHIVCAVLDGQMQIDNAVAAVLVGECL